MQLLGEILLRENIISDKDLKSALKRQVDPAHRFRNKLWDEFYEP